MLLCNPLSWQQGLQTVHRLLRCHLSELNHQGEHEQPQHGISRQQFSRFASDHMILCSKMLGEMAAQVSKMLSGDNWTTVQLQRQAWPSHQTDFLAFFLLRRTTSAWLLCWEIWCPWSQRWEEWSCIVISKHQVWFHLIVSHSLETIIVAFSVHGSS